MKETHWTFKYRFQPSRQEASLVLKFMSDKKKKRTKNSRSHREKKTLPIFCCAKSLSANIKHHLGFKSTPCNFHSPAVSSVRLVSSRLVRHRSPRCTRHSLLLTGRRPWNCVRLKGRRNRACVNNDGICHRRITRSADPVMLFNNVAAAARPRDLTDDAATSKEVSPEPIRARLQENTPE